MKNEKREKSVETAAAPYIFIETVERADCGRAAVGKLNAANFTGHKLDATKPHWELLSVKFAVVN